MNYPYLVFTMEVSRAQDPTDCADDAEFWVGIHARRCVGIGVVFRPEIDMGISGRNQYGISGRNRQSILVGNTLQIFTAKSSQPKYVGVAIETRYRAGVSRGRWGGN